MFPNIIRMFRSFVELFRRTIQGRPEARSPLLRVELLETRLCLDAELVKDINPSANDIDRFLLSIDSGFAVVNEVAYFATNSPGFGSELWRSDGSESGTFRVKDIVRGASGSHPKLLVNVNGTLLFVANDGMHGAELWKSDGTESGTQLVKDIRPGASDSQISEIQEVNGKLYFSANDGMNGTTLWQSDGTESGTIRMSPTVQFPRFLTNVAGTLFFVAPKTGSGIELWKFDGSVTGTVMVKDIFPGIASSRPYELTNANGRLFFTAWTETGSDLWVSDGSEAGTTKVKDLTLVEEYVDNPRIEILQAVGDRVYFEFDHPVHGIEIWTSDGTDAGTYLLREFGPGRENHRSGSYVSYQGNLYFAAYSGLQNMEIWRSDGTTQGTQPVSIRPGVQKTGAGWLISTGDALYCKFSTSRDSHELWKSDSKSGGNWSFVTSLPTSVVFLGHNSSKILFWSTNQGAIDLWSSDGSSIGTSLVRANMFASRDSSPTRLTNVNGTLYFVADSYFGHWGLWKSDGTSDGTIVLKQPISNSFDPSSEDYSFTAVGSLLFFSTEYELWKSDGTIQGTTMLARPGQGRGSSHLESLTNVNGILYFVVDDFIHGKEIWRSDGTAEGTRLYKDLIPGPQGATFLGQMANVNGVLYFSASTAADGGFQLWRSDPTTGNSTPIYDFKIHKPHLLTDVDGVLYFVGYDDLRGWDVWRSDGTRSGTAMVKDLTPGFSAFPSKLIEAGGKLYFIESYFNGASLGVTDGTSPGTYKLDSSVTKDAIVNVNEMLYYATQNGSVAQLRKIEPGAHQSTLVLEIPAASGQSIKHMTNANGALFFVLDDGIHGSELWKSDGTAAGTQLIDLLPEAGSSPSNLMGAGKYLFMNASHVAAGAELWKANTNVAPTGLQYSDFEIPENVPIGTPVTRLTAQDPNQFDNFTYSLVTGPGENSNAKFRILGDQIVTNDFIDFEAERSHTLRVRVTDQEGFYYDRSINFTVINVNDPPTDLALSNTSVSENLPAFSTVGNLSFTDQDSQFLDYSIVSSSEPRTFWTNNRQLLTTKVLDFETTPQYTVRIRATDHGGAYVEKEFVIQVLNAHDVPTEVRLLQSGVEENLGPRQVAKLMTLGQEPGETMQYTLVGENYRQNSYFRIEGDTLFSLSSLDYEFEISYGIRVRATDSKGFWVEGPLGVRVVDVNEQSTAVRLLNPVVSENRINQFVSRLDTIDPDRFDSYTYQLVEGPGDTDNSKFFISQDQLYSGFNVDYELKKQLSIRVQSTDAAGHVVQEVFLLDVLDENDAPINVLLSTFSFSEDVPIGTVVAELIPIDPDRNNTFTYSLVSGDGEWHNQYFSIEGNRLVTAARFNREFFRNVSIRVRVTDQGNLFTERYWELQVDSGAPRAALEIQNITSRQVLQHQFTVKLTDDYGLDLTSLDDSDIIVYGPGVFRRNATFVRVEAGVEPGAALAVYQITPGIGTWKRSNNGLYTVNVEESQIKDKDNNHAPKGWIGYFSVDIPASRWQNTSNNLDVNGNGLITPSDALIVINYLNSDFPATPPMDFELDVDVNGDELITPSDALQVIDELNYGRLNGEGEGPGALETFYSPLNAVVVGEHRKWKHSSEPLTIQTFKTTYRSSLTAANCENFRDIDGALSEVQIAATLRMLDRNLDLDILQLSDDSDEPD